MKTTWFKFLTQTPYLMDAEGDGGGGDLGDITGEEVVPEVEGEEQEEESTNEEDDDKLVDDEGRAVNEDGHLINDEGELINEDGELVDADGKVIESDDEDDDEETERITHASDLKKAFPDIFKKFPDVKAALYRDQQYSELFGSPKEAEVTVSKSNLLDRIEKDLLVDGNPEELLNSVKKDSEASFKKIAFSLLPYLAKADKETYLEVAALPIKQLLRNMVGKFDPKSNEYKAAQYVHKYFFDSLDFNSKIKAEESNVETKSAKEKEYETKISEIDQRDFNNFADSTANSYVSRITKEFRSGIESDDRLTDFMKNVLVEKGLAAIKTQLDNDPRFKRQMSSLWNSAKASSYSNDLKSRIVSTALARAKSLVPTVRAKLLAEALGKKKKDDKKDDKTNVRRFEKTDNNKRTERRPEQKKPLTDMDILRGNG